MKELFNFITFVLALLQESWATVFAAVPCSALGGISVSCCSQVHNHLEEQKRPLLALWKNQAFVGLTSKTFLRITCKAKFNPKEKKKISHFGVYINLNRAWMPQVVQHFILDRCGLGVQVSDTNKLIWFDFFPWVVPRALALSQLSNYELKTDQKKKKKDIFVHRVG